MRRHVLFFLLVTAVVIGCSPPQGRVFGKATYRGQALSDGTVIFIASDNQVYPVPIKADGTFEAASLPYGPVQVSIQQEEPRPPSRPVPVAGQPPPELKGDDDAKRGRVTPATPKARGVRVPPQFGDPKQSGFAFDLKASSLEFNAEMK